MTIADSTLQFARKSQLQTPLASALSLENRSNYQTPGHWHRNAHVQQCSAAESDPPVRKVAGDSMYGTERRRRGHKRDRT